MNERLNLQDLVDLLAQKLEMTKKDAETFLRELIALISDNIEKNEPVKIKDFGTFKLVKVNARKSVDVNTGEAIEIPAHYKLSFAPDKQLKDAINRPFSHFESVVLEEGVSFDNVISEEQTEESEESDVTIDEEVVEVAAVPKPESINIEPVEEHVELIEPAAEIVEEKVEEVNLEEEAPQEEIPQEASASTPLVESIEIAPTIQQEDQPVIVEEPIVESTDEIVEASSNYEEEMHELRRRSLRKKRLTYTCVVAALVMVVFAVGGYFYQDIMSYVGGGPTQINNKKPVTFTQVSPAIVKDSVIVADTLLDKREAIDTIIIKKTVTYQTNTTAGKKDILPKVKVTPAVTATIEEGHTMRSISMKYYGHKSFWVYIYQENKATIKNPNNVPIGTKVIIPSPEKYGIDPKNKESVDRAKKAEAKVFAEIGE